MSLKDKSSLRKGLMKMKRYYLAYGSNLFIPKMRYRCKTARLVGTAVIKDYGLLFKESKTGAYLTIESKHGTDVPVAVWEVTPEHERSLDRYEGYPDYYYKKEFQVTVTGIKSGKKRVRTAFAYILDESRSIGVPTKWYLQTCLAGYRRFGFNTINLMNAFYKSVQETVK